MVRAIAAPLDRHAWEDADAACLLHAECGVFASLPDDREAYAGREQAPVGEDAFRAGRTAFVEQVWASAQARGRHFHEASPFAEDLALRNIRREPDGLSGR
jgi:predicted metal-dependent HD superfamily phosphohydrolase